jgi:hypothetical protein
VAGIMGIENVKIGEFYIENQIIGLASKVNVPILDDVLWDGILGLGFANHNL